MNHQWNKPLEIIKKTGSPIPADSHAVSVCLYTWQDNVDYEEGMLDLDSGYPRFLMNKIVTQLDNGRVIFENQYFAQLCSKFCDRCHLTVEIGNTLLYKMDKDDKKVKQFWQHTGLGISSRQAEDILQNKTIPVDNMDLSIVTSKILQYLKIDFEDVYLFSSGMTAIFMAFLISSGPFVMFGFPYLDTLKILQKYGKCEFVTSISELKQVKNVKTIFLEFPTNPLLSVTDLSDICSIAKSKEAFIVVDDTLATFYNSDLTNYCDVLVTSLTKSFSGYGNVCAGSLCLNKNGNYYNELKERLETQYGKVGQWIYARDLKALAINCSDYEMRLQKMRCNSELFLSYLAKKLREHGDILSNFYHPEKSDSETKVWRKYCKGSCHLFSIEFANESIAKTFYDNLELNKGPSLGNWCTLVCPYTLLAHYSELDWAKRYGVKSHLIRVSVGCEDDLIERFERAFQHLLNK